MISPFFLQQRHTFAGGQNLFYNLTMGFYFLKVRETPNLSLLIVQLRRKKIAEEGESR